jgi:hypothetical protein
MRPPQRRRAVLLERREVAIGAPVISSGNARPPETPESEQRRLFQRFVHGEKNEAAHQI